MGNGTERFLSEVDASKLVSAVADGWIIEMDSLDVDECWRHVASATIGRVGFIYHNQPMVLPVNFAIARRSIVIRTTTDSMFHSLGSESPAVFEVDQIDDERRTGWSVLIKGHLWTLDRPDTLMPAGVLELHPWAPGQRDGWTRIIPAEVTGRTITRRRAQHDAPLPYMPPD